MVQITLISIDNYGPWTHTLGNDREHKLQMYQASFYETLQNMFSVHGGLVFSNRFDEYFAITDGISYSTHIDIKTKIQQLFPFEIGRITPVSEPREGRNRFRVEANLTEDISLLRPGMEGTGKILIDKRTLQWIWTHEIVEWFQLWFWYWRP